MYLISAERYQNAEVGFLRVTKTDDIWLSMKNIHDGLGLNIVSDLVLKEIYGKYGRKNFADGEIKKHKMTEREVFKNYDNLSENELNSKNNKEVYVRNDVITCVTVHYRGKKKESKKIDEFRKKLGFTGVDIMALSEYLIKSEIGKMFANEKIFEEYYVKIYEIGLYFYKNW